LTLWMAFNILWDSAGQSQGEQPRLSDHAASPADLYEQFVLTWLIRDQARTNHINVGTHDKLSVLGFIAWRIFCTSFNSKAEYGHFLVADLCTTRSELTEEVEVWARRYDPKVANFSTHELYTVLTERTLLVPIDEGTHFRFAHKSFFEYMLARHVCTVLATPTS